MFDENQTANNPSFSRFVNFEKDPILRPSAGDRVRQSRNVEDEVVSGSLEKVVDRANTVQRQDVAPPKDVFAGIEKAELAYRTWVAQQESKIAAISSPRIRALHEARMKQSAIPAAQFLEAKKIEYSFNEAQDLEHDERNTALRLINSGVLGRDAIQGAKDNSRALKLISALRLQGDDGEQLVNSMMADGERPGVISVDKENGVYFINNKEAFAELEARYASSRGASDKGRESLISAAVADPFEENLRRGGSGQSGEDGVGSISKSLSEFAKAQEVLEDSTSSPVIRQQAENFIQDYTNTVITPYLENTINKNQKVAEESFAKINEQGGLDKANEETIMAFAQPVFTNQIFEMRRQGGTAAITDGLRKDQMLTQLQGLANAQNTRGEDATPIINKALEGMLEGSDYIVFRGTASQIAEQRANFYAKAVTSDPSLLDTIIIEKAKNGKVNAVARGADVAARAYTLTRGADIAEPEPPAPSEGIMKGAGRLARKAANAHATMSWPLYNPRKSAEAVATFGKDFVDVAFEETLGIGSSLKTGASRFKEGFLEE
jgi:hypothetical protein